MSMKVKVVHEKAIVPRRSTPGDAGLDLFAVGDVVIPPWSQAIVETGLELVEVPKFTDSPEWGTVVQIWPRSGLSAKHGLDTGAGVIDGTYRGPILIVVRNQSDDTVFVPYGKAIAQALVLPVYVGPVETAESGQVTERGAAGGITSIFASITKKGECND